MKLTQELLESVGKFLASPTALAQINALISSEPAPTDVYITADMARALAPGNTEYLTPDGSWHATFVGCAYSENYKYRAIKQPVEPIDPHASLRAQYAQQVKDGTVGDYVWKFKSAEETVGDIGVIAHHPVSYTPKPRTTVNGESMPIEKAKVLYESTKETHDWSHFGCRLNNYVPQFICVTGYTYHTKKPMLKPIYWSKVPVGAMTNEGELVRCEDGHAIVLDMRPSRRQLGAYKHMHIRLAPASEQKWIAVQDDDGTLYEGLTYRAQFCHPEDDCEMMLRYKVIGLADGYTDNPELAGGGV